MEYRPHSQAFYDVQAWSKSLVSLFGALVLLTVCRIIRIKIEVFQDESGERHLAKRDISTSLASISLRRHLNAALRTSNSSLFHDEERYNQIHSSGCV